MHDWLFGVLMIMTQLQTPSQPLMIAHAGGGYLGQNYTNSIQALDHSYAAGFRYFEIDFSWTSDQQLVCLHDWKKTFKKLFKIKTKAPFSLAEFTELSAAHPQYTACTLERLAVWIKQHPDSHIITDIKEHNLAGIRLILGRHPEIQSQLIPQFYQPEEYSLLRELGFGDLIWILYQYKGSKKSVVQHSQTMQLLAVSMRAAQAKSRTLQKLRQWHQIFVYTVNDDGSKDQLTEQYGVSGIYTDFLPFRD